MINFEDWDEREQNAPSYDPTDNIPFGYFDEGIEDDRANMIEEYYDRGYYNSKNQLIQNKDWYHQI